MPTDTKPVQYFSSTLADTNVAENENGTGTVTGLKVFRVGSHRDSKGKKRSYEAADLDKMVDKFNELRDAGILPHVPVRADHSSSVLNIVGYFAGLRREGDFLVADVEFTEPSALEKFKRGTFRGRSLEVGKYQDGADKIHENVVQGLAFVDLPAVERLYRKEFPEEGTTVTEENQTPEPQTFRLRGVATTDYAAVQTYIDETEKNQGQPPERHNFRVAGAEVNDPAAVQQHIDGLETFRKDVRENARVEFVKQLAKDSKIAATQIDTLTEHAKGLDDEQYKTFCASYEKAPANSMFNKTGDGDGANNDDKSKEHTEKDDLEEMIAEFRRMDWSDKQIEESTAYKRLQAIKS